MPKIISNYYNPGLKIALGKWDQAFLIPDSATEKPVALLPELYKSGLVNRLAIVVIKNHKATE